MVSRWQKKQGRGSYTGMHACVYAVNPGQSKRSCSWPSPVTLQPAPTVQGSLPTSRETCLIHGGLYRVFMAGVGARWPVVLYVVFLLFLGHWPLTPTHRPPPPPPVGTTFHRGDPAVCGWPRGLTALRSFCLFFIHFSLVVRRSYVLISQLLK